MNRGSIWIVCALITNSLTLSGALTAQAQTTAFTFVDPVTGTESAAGVDGFKFQALANIEVTDLGYYDRDQNGLTLTHAVGIYDFDSQQLLVSADVGPSSFLDGLFRYTTIAPFSLNAGASYVVVGFHPGSPTADRTAQISGARQVNSAAEVRLDEYRFTETTEFVFPLTNADPERFFGPNFRYTLGGDISEFDFNSDGQANCADINQLATAVANNMPETRFDLNNDFQVDVFDVENWLTRAGLAINGTAYKNGDANLDSAVNDSDLAVWTSHRFTTGSWCSGDFNADGFIDGSDFNIWNDAFHAAAAASPVPESHSTRMLLGAFVGLMALRRFLVG